MNLTGNATMCDNDLVVNREIRKILVRYWIDLGRLTVSTNEGKSVLQGALMRLPGSESSLGCREVEQLMSDIEHIPHVLSLATELDNWVCLDGAWRPVGG